MENHFWSLHFTAMRQIFIFLLAFPISAAVTDEQITCYECEFTEFSDGRTEGDEHCVYISDQTPTLTDSKYGETLSVLPQVGTRGFR